MLRTAKLVGKIVRWPVKATLVNIRTMVKTAPARLPLTVALSLLVIAAACGGEDNPFKVKSERVTQADNVSAMQFAPDGRLFYTEQFSGNVRILNADGSPQSEPFAHVDPALYLEWGLTGIALDPDFATNHYVYIYYSQPVKDLEETVTPAPDSTATPGTRQVKTARPVVMRFTEQAGKGQEPTVIVGDLPETFPDHPGFNANGKIHFGPDRFLYLTLGDYDVQGSDPNHPSQNLSSPIGKILRVNKEDGSAAPGNPFIAQAGADPRVFAYGFREPFDFTFHPQTGKIYGSDNTPVDCEELNVIEPGANYGWPNVGEFPYPECGAGGQKQAIHYFAREHKQPNEFLSFVEISSFGFATAAKYPTLGDSMIACQLGSDLGAAGPAEPWMRQVVLAPPQFEQVTADAIVIKDCKLSLAANLDGTIYYSNDKEIKRLLPEGP
jgi:glucose/arabinose dehydrogenase